MTDSETPKLAADLVEKLADRSQRIATWQELDRLGRSALPAIRQGLRHGHWQVRKWCAILLDHHADPESLPELIPLLHDPKKDVRLWAVHSLSCDRCKEGQNPIDVFPLLVERIELDQSIRVRRMAVAMLACRKPEARLVRLFQHLLETETDSKIRRQATHGLKRCRTAGLVST